MSQAMYVRAGGALHEVLELPGEVLVLGLKICQLFLLGLLHLQ